MYYITESVLIQNGACAHAACALGVTCTEMPALEYTLEWALLASGLRLYNVYYITESVPVQHDACPHAACALE